MNLAFLIESINIIINSEKRYIFLICLVSGGIIWYQYDLNKVLYEKITNNENRCSDLMSKQYVSCQEQINLSRARQQEQIDNFIIKSNNERDSIYFVLRKLVNKSNKKINESLTELNKFKDESSN